MPENGQPLRHVSIADPPQGGQSGHQRCRMDSARPRPSGTKNAASRAHIASQASVPTDRIQPMTVKEKAMPKTRVGSQAREARRPWTQSISTAIAGGISQDRPTGSKAAARDRPPTRAARQRTSTGQTVTDRLHACSGAGGTARLRTNARPTG